MKKTKLIICVIIAVVLVSILASCNYKKEIQEETVSTSNNEGQNESIGVSETKKIEKQTIGVSETKEIEKQTIGVSETKEAEHARIRQMAFYECYYGKFSEKYVTIYDDQEEEGCYYIRFGFEEKTRENCEYQEMSDVCLYEDHTYTAGGILYCYWFNSNTDMLYKCTINNEDFAIGKYDIEDITNKKGDGGHKISGDYEDVFRWQDVIAIADKYTGNTMLQHNEW